VANLCGVSQGQMAKVELRACADRLATFHICPSSARLNRLLIDHGHIYYPPIRAASKDDEAVLKEKLEQDEQLVRNLEELMNASSSDRAADSLQIMAGTVGIAYAQGARNHGAIVGVLEDAPPQPKSAPLENPAWSGKNTRFLERPERGAANDAHEEFDD
jgi:hypothetical protein